MYQSAWAALTKYHRLQGLHSRNSFSHSPRESSRWRSGWFGRFTREKNGNPLQFSCLRNPMDWGAWQGYSLLGRKSVGYDLVAKQQQQQQELFLVMSSHGRERGKEKKVERRRWRGFVSLLKRPLIPSWVVILMISSHLIYLESPISKYYHSAG